MGFNHNIAVSCVMPAFNEQESIGEAVTSAARALERYCDDFEIIVVDDGSTDGTAEQLARLQCQFPFRVVRSTWNRGYGWALRAGLEVASRPLVFFTDSDNQFDAMELQLLIDLIGDADIVVGRRLVRSEGWRRVIASRCYNSIAQATLGVSVPDVNCAFKLARREALTAFPLLSDTYAINAEMMARSRQAGLRIASVGVSHRPRCGGRSKVRFWDVPVALLRLALLRRSLRRPILSGAVDSAVAGATAPCGGSEVGSRGGEGPAAVQ